VKVMKGKETLSIALLSGMLLGTVASQAIAQTASEQLFPRRSAGSPPDEL
jgi:hypothetical protein